MAFVECGHFLELQDQHPLKRLHHDDFAAKTITYYLRHIKCSSEIIRKISNHYFFISNHY